jgi:hypothetical protein
MTTFATPELTGELGVVAEIRVVLRPDRRDTLEALGLILGMLGILLGVVLTVGAAFPIGQ